MQPRIMNVFHPKHRNDRHSSPAQEDLQHLKEELLQIQEIGVEKAKLYSSDSTAKVRAEMKNLHEEIIDTFRNAEETRKADMLEVKNWMHECASRLQQEIKVVAKTLEERMHEALNNLDSQLRDWAISEDMKVTMMARSDLYAYQEEVKQTLEQRSKKDEEVRADQRSQLEAAVAMLRQESSGLFEKAKTAMSRELEEISQQRQQQHDTLARQLDSENQARFQQLEEAIATTKTVAEQGLAQGAELSEVMAREAPVAEMFAGVERTKQRLDLEVVFLREAVAEVAKVFGPAGSRPTLSSYGRDAIQVTERCAEWCIPDVSKKLLREEKVWLSPRFEAWGLKNLQLELILNDGGEPADQSGKCSVALWADIGSRLDFRFFMGAESWGGACPLVIRQNDGQMLSAELRLSPLL
eukprot:gnl/TRDRNA2_/TRDRNA2_153555_c0_seq3.p1 gnl/TRDRNA2_/TRDRNA2_153555_c0~~gnl/TRDRNA2_/TRDRNA2_153555_c0_seq3.p1  ORF type:complete len:411 (-),score=105.64 gnl/TRDRNA2_/TRDRNA2_153555_c0_seq3:15-1247(-)